MSVSVSTVRADALCCDTDTHSTGKNLLEKKKKLPAACNEIMKLNPQSQELIELSLLFFDIHTFHCY